METTRNPAQVRRFAVAMRLAALVLAAAGLQPAIAADASDDHYRQTVGRRSLQRVISSISKLAGIAPASPFVAMCLVQIKFHIMEKASVVILDTLGVILEGCRNFPKMLLHQKRDHPRNNPAVASVLVIYEPQRFDCFDGLPGTPNTFECGLFFTFQPPVDHDGLLRDFTVVNLIRCDILFTREKQSRPFCQGLARFLGCFGHSHRMFKPGYTEREQSGAFNIAFM